MQIKSNLINEMSMLKSLSSNEMMNSEPACAERSRSMSYKKQ